MILPSEVGHLRGTLKTITQKADFQKREKRDVDEQSQSLGILILDLTLTLDLKAVVFVFFTKTHEETINSRTPILFQRYWNEEPGQSKTFTS